MAIESGFKRYSARLKVNSQVKSWLNAGANLSYVNTLQQAPPASDSRTDNVINAARVIPSFYPYYERNENGSYVLDKMETEYTILVNTDLPVLCRMRTQLQHSLWIKMKEKLIISLVKDS